MSKNILTLDLEEIFSYAEAGIRRAAIFSGIVLNDKNEISIEDLNIIDGFSLLPSNYNKDEIIKEYKLFTTKNALREMVELFEQTLINLYQMLNIANDVKTSDDLEKIPAKTKVFGEKSFPNKLNTIDELLDKKLSRQKDFWEGLQLIRNSITHYIGVTHKEEISIAIPRMTAFIKEKETGKETVLGFGALLAPVRIDSEYDLLVKLEHIDKTFKKGEIISFNNQEIAMLILGMKFSLDALRKILHEHLLSKKIPLQDKSTNTLVKSIDELNSHVNKIQTKEVNNANN